MADVNVQGDGGSTNTVLAIVVIALLAVLAWFFFARGGTRDGADIRVDVNPPAATGGAPGGGTPPNP
jgi:hypothetical protein